MTPVLTLISAAVGSAAAVLGLLAPRFRTDPRVGWLGVALGVDGLLALATSVPDPFTADAQPVLHAVRLFVHGIVVALLTTAVFAPRSPSSRGVGEAVLGVTALAAVTAAMGTAFPDAVRAAALSTPVRLSFTLAWALLACAITVLAVRRRAGSLALVGVGVALAGAVHTAGAATTTVPFGEVSPLIPSLRLVAVAVVLSGMLALALRTLTDLDTARDAQDEELRLAELRLASAAERDHELRNGLAGLAGAATLLGDERPEAAALGRAVASELARLDHLLRSADGRSRTTFPAVYAVAPVLDGQVMLRRSSGTEVELEVDPDLQAVGSPDTLAQVIVNLIGNAERHAPGSPIRVSASRHADRILIVVRDHGPGIAPGHEQAVFAPGVRDPRREGHGLGLSVCRRMLATDNGTITVLPPDPLTRGCVVMVALPAQPVLDAPTLPVVGRSARCVAS